LQEREGLTEAQRGFYQEQGYLVVENVLSAQELEALRAASERVQSERQRLGGADRLAVIHNITLLDGAFAQASRHPVMLASVTDLIGPNLRLQHAKLNWKPPTAGTGEVEWHQDFPFFPHTNFDLLACMFLLDDATPDNGCMRVIPGSHHLGPVPHDDDGGFRGHVTQRHYVDEQSAVDLAVPAGSMTIHHCLALHASYPNRSAHPRRGLVYQIAAADAIQLGGNMHKVWGTMLQGEETLWARLQGGPSFRLPATLQNRGGLQPHEDLTNAIKD
jgi:ectoine hydroxylase-related dioxygenase (phytanoyl-CoA dioxygenase family)